MEDYSFQDLFGSDVNSFAKSDSQMDDFLQFGQAISTNNFELPVRTDATSTTFGVGVSSLAGASSSSSLASEVGDFSISSPCPFSDLVPDLNLATTSNVSGLLPSSTASLASVLGSQAKFSSGTARTSQSAIGDPPVVPVLQQPVVGGLGRNNGLGLESVLDTARGSKNVPDHEYKLSKEYADKRARNNAAVRKSRIKAKQKSKETEEEVEELRNENDELKRSLESLQSQLNTLRALQPGLFDDVDQEE